MSYLKLLNRQQFEALSWSVGDVVINGSEDNGGTLGAWGSVFIKLTSDLDSEEDDENLPLIWFDFTVDVNYEGKNILDTSFEELQEDPLGLNLISFCDDDLLQAPQLVESVVNNSDWKEKVVLEIQKTLL